MVPADYKPRLSENVLPFYGSHVRGAAVVASFMIIADHKVLVGPQLDRLGGNPGGTDI